MQLWVADGERGLMRAEDGALHRLGPPCGALCVGWGRIFCAEQHRCVCRGQETGEALFDLPLPTGVCALTVWESQVCALSADADSVTAFSPDTGEILFCAPAGRANIVSNSIGISFRMCYLILVVFSIR